MQLDGEWLAVLQHKCHSDEHTHRWLQLSGPLLFGPAWMAAASRDSGHWSTVSGRDTSCFT